MLAGQYFGASRTTLHGHEKIGLNKLQSSEEGHRGYEKSGSHRVIVGLHSIFPSFDSVVASTYNSQDKMCFYSILLHILENTQQIE